MDVVSDGIRQWFLIGAELKPRDWLHHHFFPAGAKCNQIWEAVLLHNNQIKTVTAGLRLAPTKLHQMLIYSKRDVLSISLQLIG